MIEEKSTNPLAVRSRKWIVEALLELMKEKEYEKITIKEVTERADLVRKTFYRNFASKDEIIQYYIAELTKEVEYKLVSEPDLTPFRMAEIYFSFWSEHLAFLQLLQKNGLFILILHQLDELLPCLNDALKGAYLSKFSETYVAYYTVFNSAGIWHVLQKWVERGGTETPTEMAHIYVNLILANPYEE